MDIAGIVIAFIFFWIGWLACIAFTVAKGNRREQQQDDVEQAEYLRKHAKQRMT